MPETSVETPTFSRIDVRVVGRHHLPAGDVPIAADDQRYRQQREQHPANPLAAPQLAHFVSGGSLRLGALVGAERLVQSATAAFLALHPRGTGLRRASAIALLSRTVGGALLNQPAQILFDHSKLGNHLLNGVALQPRQERRPSFPRPKCSASRAGALLPRSGTAASRAGLWGQGDARSDRCRRACRATASA